MIEQAVSRRNNGADHRRKRIYRGVQIAFALIEAVTDTVAKGQKVQLIGFGTFERRQRTARAGKNPRTGEAIKIPASYAPAFKAGKAFKEKANKTKAKKTKK